MTDTSLNKKVRDLMKTTGILTADPEDSLGSAVSKLHSSHDAVFVLNGGGRYLGVINPYHSLIRNGRNNGDSKVKNCLFHPPRLAPDDSLERVVHMMRDARVHYLPVVDEKHTLIGVVSARRIMREMRSSERFNGTIESALQDKDKPIVSVYAKDEISKIRHLFEEEDVSKLVVIDEDMKLDGIMSYYDLIPHFIAPTDKPDSGSKLVRIDDQDMFVHLKVKNVMQMRVHTRKPDDDLRTVVSDIITREIGSVVIVNRQGYPVGILTNHDLLTRLTTEPQGLIIELTTNSISPENMAIVHEYGPHIDTWVKKLKDIERVHMLLKEEKNGHLFKLRLSIIPTKGKPQIITDEGKDLVQLLKNSIKKR